MLKPDCASPYPQTAHISISPSRWMGSRDKLTQAFEMVFRGRRVFHKAVTSEGPRFHSLVLLQNITHSAHLSCKSSHGPNDVIQTQCSIKFLQDKTAIGDENQVLARKALLEQNNFQIGELREHYLQRSVFLSYFDQMSFKGDCSPISVFLSSILWDGEGQNSGRSFLLYKSLATDIVKGSVALHCVYNLQIKAP